MTWRRPRSWTQWIRRLSQTIFLLFFLWLVLATRFAEENQPSPLLRFFFDLDPLVFLATLLSAYAVPTKAVLAATTVLVTVLLGRVFCGWVCPLGTVLNMASWFRKAPEPPLVSESRSPWQRGKYYLLFALLLMALFGVHWIGIFDPLSLLYRSVATTVLPAAQYGIEDGATAVYRVDPHIGPVRLTWFTEPVYRLFRDRVFVVPRQAFTGSTLLALILVVIVLLNLVRPRFWCRYLCPLGALLGQVAGRTAMRLQHAEGACNNCAKCSLACPAAAQPDKAGQWLSQECFGCWNCVAACNSNAITFRFESPARRFQSGKLDLSRRAALAAGLSGLTGIFLVRLTPQAQAKTFRPELIRPPGARSEREFVQRCIQCGLCMRVCPTNALQPAGFEAGLEGLWSPKLVPKIGYCEHQCCLCGQVCPTEAIQPLPLEEKQKVKIGLAVIDTTRCLPYASGRDCIVCEEHCPVSPKAIYFVEEEVSLRDGAGRLVKLPRVDPDLCIGCGICETKCPFTDVAAIRVTSANESRHPANQPILPAPAGPYGA